MRRGLALALSILFLTIPASRSSKRFGYLLCGKGGASGSGITGGG